MKVECGHFQSMHKNSDRASPSAQKWLAVGWPNHVDPALHVEQSHRVSTGWQSPSQQAVLLLQMFQASPTLSGPWRASVSVPSSTQRPRATILEHLHVRALFVPGTWHRLSYLIFRETLWRRYHQSHYTNEDTETEGPEVMQVTSTGVGLILTGGLTPPSGPKGCPRELGFSLL